MEYDRKVTVYCAAYNHEKYIEKALEGFIKQETSFEYEVIVHDDASTDHTQEIIKRYEKKYPDIICPIYQRENQYSQGHNSLVEFVLPVARGQYIAFCEGDDFWIDQNKLAKQVAFLDAHEEYAACYGANYEIDHENETIVRINQITNYDRELSTAECILPKEMPHTSTCVIRKSILEKRPDFCLHTAVGDIVILSWAAVNGKVFYFHDFFSCYRLGVPGSWTVRSHNNSKMHDHHNTSMRFYFEQLNQYTYEKYNDLIDEKLDSYRMYEQRKQGEILKVLRNKAYKKGSMRQKAAWILETVAPVLISSYRRIRYK